jgi:hypothetical protein
MHPYISQALVAERVREARKQAASARLAAIARGAKSRARTHESTESTTSSSLSPVRWAVRRA